MHENLKTTFSIKAEDNTAESMWQHLRSERRSLSFFSLYGKMTFDVIENNYARPTNFSLLVHEFKTGFQKFGLTTRDSIEIDMHYDVDIKQPVYFIAVELDPISTDHIKTINFKLKEDLNILKCTDNLYVTTFKQEIDADHHRTNGNNRDKINTDYKLYLDIKFKDVIDEEDHTINLLDIIKYVPQNGLIENLKKIDSAYPDPGTGTVITRRCRPTYVQLIP